MRKAFAAFFAVLALTCAARAETVYAKMPAHPALWTVHGPKGTAYLFGSVHLLPPNVDWHTREIDAAIANSDVLVFELQMDAALQAQMQKVIQERALLPEGQHLRDMLPPGSQKDFDEKVKASGMPPAFYDRMRPWFAEISFELNAIKKQHYDTDAGVESAIKKEDGDKRPVIGLETLDEQISILAPTDPKVELESFESDLKTTDAPPQEEIGPLLDAWMHGRVDRLAALTTKDFENYPNAQKVLFDDRNAKWVTKIAALLDEPKTYFITVGAGHLAGPRGVPALLRAKGFRVEGP